MGKKRKIIVVLIIMLVLPLFVLYPIKVEADVRESFVFDSPPTRIIIPSIGRSLPVESSPLVYNTWEVSLEGASYGESTAIPGTGGNTVIFAHALPTFFGLLPNVRQGDLIHVFTDKDWFVYKAQEILVVDPEEKGVLFDNEREELTLYTCTGEEYLRRFVVKATGVVGFDKKPSLKL